MHHLDVIFHEEQAGGMEALHERSRGLWLDWIDILHGWVRYLHVSVLIIVSLFVLSKHHLCLFSWPARIYSGTLIRGKVLRGWVARWTVWRRGERGELSMRCHCFINSHSLTCTQISRWLFGCLARMYSGTLICGRVARRTVCGRGDHWWMCALCHCPINSHSLTCTQINNMKRLKADQWRAGRYEQYVMAIRGRDGQRWWKKFDRRRWLKRRSSRRWIQPSSKQQSYPPPASSCTTAVPTLTLQDTSLIDGEAVT